MAVVFDVISVPLLTVLRKVRRWFKHADTTSIPDGLRKAAIMVERSGSSLNSTKNFQSGTSTRSELQTNTEYRMALEACCDIRIGLAKASPQS